VRLPLKGQATGLLTADGANTPALSLDQAFRIDLKVMTWNPDAAMWSVRHLFAQKVHGGSTRVGQQTAMVAPAQLNVEGWRFLESGCVVFLLCSVWEHALMFRKRNAARRSTPRVNQLLQLSGKVTLLVSSLLYLVLLSMNLTLHIAASFPVYDDLYAAARFLLLKKRPPGVGGGGGSPCGGDVAETQTLLEGDYANGLIDDTMSSLFIRDVVSKCCSAFNEARAGPRRRGTHAALGAGRRRARAARAVQRHRAPGAVGSAHAGVSNPRRAGLATVRHGPGAADGRAQPPHALRGERTRVLEIRLDPPHGDHRTDRLVFCSAGARDARRAGEWSMFCARGFS
jgi:hypothetical protein